MHGTRDEVVPLPPPFEIVLRGFDRQQVIDHVNALKTRVSRIAAERDAALQRAADLDVQLERLRREAAETTRQVDRLRRDAELATTEVDRLQRSPLAVATTRIQRMLQMAEDEATELQTSAEQESTSLRDSARAEADQLLAEARRQCERLEVESTSRLRAADTEFADRHQRAEQQSEHGIASRQAEIEAWISDYQTRSIAALYLLMQIAGERLSSRMARVTRQVTAAKALRSEVTGQLSAVQRLLVEALGVVEQPTASEQARQIDAAEQARQIDAAEQARQIDAAEQARQTEHAEQAEAPAPAPEPPAPAPAPAPEPPADTSLSGGRAGALRPKERSGPVGRPQRANQRTAEADAPTARFGLHP